MTGCIFQKNLFQFKLSLNLEDGRLAKLQSKDLRISFAYYSAWFCS